MHYLSHTFILLLYEGGEIGAFFKVGKSSIDFFRLRREGLSDS